MALSKNAGHVRELAIDLLSLVYYMNGLVVFNDLQARSTDRSISQPRWVALSDPHSCLVHPILSATLLAKPTIRIWRDATTRTCPYSLPSVINPRAAMTQVSWMLQLNSSLQELEVSGLIFKDFRDSFVLCDTISTLVELRKLELRAYFWEEVPLPLSMAIVLCCPLSLQELRLTFVPKGCSQDQDLFEGVSRGVTRISSSMGTSGRCRRCAVRAPFRPQRTAINRVEAAAYSADSAWHPRDGISGDRSTVLKHPNLHSRDC